MRQRDDQGTGKTPATPIHRARIVWKDEDTGESLWLGLTGSQAFFEDLGHAGFDLQHVPDALSATRPDAQRGTRPVTESIPPSLTEPYAA